MRKNQSSLTAAGIAIVRAVESERPADERICYDPFARCLVPAWMFRIFGFLMKIGYTEWRGPGVNGFLVARERYIDHVLQRCLNEGLQQLVILGAGYDARAYRFDLSGIRVFEVGHAATQADKVAKLHRIFGNVPEHVMYVPIDFNHQTLQECLPKAGYDPTRRSLFLWQGVSMYLIDEAVDSTLAFVANCSGAGSTIVFDYIYRSVLEARKQSEVRGMRRYGAMTGEGLIFGIPEDAVETFLKERGFRRVKDVNAKDLKEAYFTGRNAGRVIAGGYGIVVATT